MLVVPMADNNERHHVIDAIVAGSEHNIFTSRKHCKNNRSHFLIAGFLTFLRVVVTSKMYKHRK